MSKNIKTTIFVIILVLVTTMLYSYDGVQVRKYMRELAGLAGQAKAAQQEKDYFKIAHTFMEMAEIFNELRDMEPPRGSEQIWRKTYTDIIKHLFRGIGACGEENDAQIAKALDEVFRLRNSGHGTFR